MSFLEGTDPADFSDVEPEDWEAQEKDLQSAAGRLRAELNEIAGKQSALAEKRFTHGPSRREIRSRLMDELDLFDDDDDPMPKGVAVILDQHAKAWQNEYRQRSHAADGEAGMPMAHPVHGITLDAMIPDFTKSVARDVDDWLDRRANSRNRRPFSLDRNAAKKAEVDARVGRIRKLGGVEF
ncbi:hypothetical protein [Streptomyces albireticuli]|uniref:Uncharacterized protein n=1 Tax=Streptomyces albireticuli TaxID=1940 RepID=A0A2A2D5J8_9ACTN|nr:hypothetical protein [Streptomyces albireticuli]MCD9196212.1 hypothetical protein [Streptomyces albireticuli]PAU46716.1 hypothetical protein CK936_22625 [Streptomyces albireticuli]